MKNGGLVNLAQANSNILSIGHTSTSIVYNGYFSVMHLWLLARFAPVSLSIMLKAFKG